MVNDEIGLPALSSKLYLQWPLWSAAGTYASDKWQGYPCGPSRLANTTTKCSETRTKITSCMQTVKKITISTATATTTLLSRTNWVSRHQKGKPLWILLKQEMMGWQWHQLDQMQIICTWFHTDNHASTLTLSFYRPDALPATWPIASKHWSHAKICKYN